MADSKLLRIAGADSTADGFQRLTYLPNLIVLDFEPSTIMILAREDRGAGDARDPQRARKTAAWLRRRGFGQESLGVSADGGQWILLAIWPDNALGEGGVAQHRRTKLAEALRRRLRRLLDAGHVTGTKSN
ncbi:MAG TPA: hypothetical protein VH120_09720 [Gemmataceae bacterium]|nr:hypothetical protein [Gemmataceae bacterium]